MRALLVSALLSLASSTLSAQGWIVPRPCLACPDRGSGVALRSSRIAVELADGVLRYEITETFVNRGGAIGEADYMFPLPAGAAFRDLKLSINGEMVSGEIMDAGKARSIYEEIVRRQRDPALVEWMGRGLLRARIFPIAPGEEKRVVVRYDAVAIREGDAVRVDYSRGRRIEDDRPRRGRGLGGEERDDRDSEFALTYPRDAALGSPYSPTHSLDIRNDSRGRRTVEVSGSARDVTILLPLRKRSEAAITALTHAPSRSGGFVLLTLSPPAIATANTPRDLTFVVDVSGSMRGKKIQQAREAGRQVLATLRPMDRFRIIDFATDVRVFRDRFLPATAENIRAAERYVDDLEADGSTNISGALDAALEDRPERGRLSLVLFVTDGAPTVGERNPERILARVERQRAAQRLFTFGVGADVNASLVEQLAIEGGGTAQFVRPDESVERAVSIVARRLTDPVVTNVRLSAEGVRLRGLLPGGPQDIFAGQDLVMLARYEGNGPAHIEFTGTTAAGPVRWSTRAQFAERSHDNAFVARLWATQRIGYLTAERRRHGGSREVDTEIRELGETYGIPTEFTSYLVLEPGMGAPAMARGRDMTLQSAAAPALAFESAKAASAQRSATSLSAADAAVGTSRTDVTRAGGRTFRLRSGVWTDTRSDTITDRVRVRAFSAAWFDILRLMPELRDVFALGERVVVAGRGVVVEIGTDGEETLSPATRALLLGAWK